MGAGATGNRAKAFDFDIILATFSPLKQRFSCLVGPTHCKLRRDLY